VLDLRTRVLELGNGNRQGCLSELQLKD